MGGVMSFASKLFGGNSDGPTSGGAPEEQGPGSGNTGYREDGSNPYVDKSNDPNVWNKILGMSQAGGAAKEMMSTSTGNEKLNPRAMAAVGGGRPDAVNPKAAAWDRYTAAYSPKGDGAPDPGDTELFDMIWD